jgi:DNA gyrase/topoisomerase IV subunit A
LRFSEKTTKLSKNIVDQEVVIQDLEEQLKEFGEKFRDAMESQEAATEELIKVKAENIDLQEGVNEEQTRREYISKVDLIEAYETQYKFQRFWRLHAVLIVLAFFVCMMADNLV